MLLPTNAPRHRVKFKQRTPRSTRSSGRHTQRVLVAALLAVGLGAPATLLLRAVVRDGLADPASVARRFQVGGLSTDESPLLRLPTAPAALPGQPAAAATTTAARAAGWSTPAPDAPVSRSWETPYASGNGRSATNVNPSAPLAAAPAVVAANPALAAARAVGVIPATPFSSGAPSAPVGLHGLAATAPAALNPSLVAAASTTTTTTTLAANTAAALSGAGVAAESALHPVAVAFETSGASSAGAGPRSRLAGPGVNIAPAADTVWQGPLAFDTPSPTSNWTDNRNWTNGAPVNDGTSDVAFGAARAGTNSVVDTAYAINSLVFQPGASAYNVNNGGGSADLFIGAGGIHNDSTNTQTLAVEIFATANQSIAANSGQLDLPGAAPNPSQSPVSLYLLGSGRTATVEGAGNTNISGIVSEGSGPTAGALVKSGTGTLILAGDNTFTGGVTLNAGTLQLDNNNALGTGIFTVNGGAVSTGATFVTLPNAVTLNGNLDLGGSNFGFLTFNGPVSLGAATRTINGALNNFGALAFGGVISGTDPAAGLAFTRTSESSNSFTLQGEGANTYTGDTTVDNVSVFLNKEGVVAVPGNLLVQNGGSVNSSGFQLAATTNVSVNTGGSFTVSSGGDETVNGLNGDNTANVFLGNQFSTSVLTVSQGDFAGVIQNGFASEDSLAATGRVVGPGLNIAPGATGGALFKTGSGTLTLSGNNTYTDGTTVAAGILLVNNVPSEPGDSGTGFGGVLVVDGALLGGSGSVGSGEFATVIGGSLDVPARADGAVVNQVVDGAGVLAPGASLGTAGVLTVNGALTLTNTALLEIELGGTASGSFDQVNVGGAIALGGDLSLALINGFSLSVGQTFFILNGTGLDAVSGAFANVTPGVSPTLGTFTDPAGNQFLVNYAGTNPSDPGLTPGNDVSLTVLVVPEPGTWALLAFGGLAGLGAVIRRRRRQELAVGV